MVSDYYGSCTLFDIYNNHIYLTCNWLSIYRDRSGERVMCSKCNSIFESETDFLKHYNGQHSFAGWVNLCNSRYKKTSIPTEGWFLIPILISSMLFC